MRSIKSKGFTLVELIIVMVLLGILAAVAVPRMSQSIMAGEEAAEQKMLSTIVSALEIHANDEFLRNSVKSYSRNPFDVLDKTPQGDINSGEGWWVESQGDYPLSDHNGNNYSVYEYKIKHVRNSGDEYAWDYVTKDPHTVCCNGDNRPYTAQGSYSIYGPGYGGNY
jgi:prepilin-type N-terminal cleavage/methylation domain-containing protein